MARGDKKEEREKAERETRRRLAQAQIRQFPDPVLRSETRPILEFDEELTALSLRMCELADDAVGAGLAAPQIGLLRKFVVISLRDDEPWLASNLPAAAWMAARVLLSPLPLKALINRRSWARCFRSLW